MPKGLVDQLLGLYQSILTDFSDEHPTLRRGFERDYSRLESLAEHWGEKVFTLLLPALGKLLDSSLESGALVFHGEPLTRPINGRSSIPRLFQGIWKRIAQANGCLKQDIVARDIFMLRTLCFAAKKLELPCSNQVKFLTIKEYYDVDSQLPLPSKIWRGEEYDSAVVRGWSLLDHPALDILFECDATERASVRDLLARTQRIGDRVSSMLGEFLPQHHRFRHGPGAVSDLQTGLASKYAFPAWSSRLNEVFPKDEFSSANSSVWLDPDLTSITSLPSEEEGASRLHVVPKTQKAPRLIAAEPTANQWCQQSLWSFLRERVRDTALKESIDFSRQDLSGDAALRASFTGQDATIDLSAASDRLSCWLIERLFRANYSLLRGFTAVRTRFVLNDLDKKSPKLYELRKFASMGSALTFPVQSISFFIICVSAGLATDSAPDGEWETYARRVRVYGDDLIVPVEWMPCVRRLLGLLFLKVNESKTFSRGKFRESCGVDAYNGERVTPAQVREFYAESKPSSLQSVVDTSNNLYEVGLFRAARYLLSPIPPGMRKLIPWVPVGARSFGLWTASGFRSTARKRWNKNLHYWEYETLGFTARRSTTSRNEGFENLLQYFTEEPWNQDLSSWSSGLFSKVTTRMGRSWRRIENPLGVM